MNSWLVQLGLATPVVLWGGWPFSCVLAIDNQSQSEHFTLIGLGVSVAYVYSVVAIIFPEHFGVVPEMELLPVYFEAAAVITTLCVARQVMELRARSRTVAAIKALLGLAPKRARRVRADG